jgi:hypothetical protein
VSYMTRSCPILPTPPTISGPSSTVENGAAWQSILAQVGWPQDVVVLDFETFFSADYHMGKGGLSTIEYIMDPRYEEIGLACLVIPGDMPNSPRQATFWPGVKEQLLWLQKKYGPNLERCTVVIQNARFDGTILGRKHKIAPPYVVDTLALSRHQDARNTHNLHDLCERYGLPPKGDTMQFKGKHWATMTEEEKQAMSAYSCNDAEREMDLFAILLPKLTRPRVELALQYHTLTLFWAPLLRFDFKLAEELQTKMNGEMEKALLSVKWVLNG